MSRCCVVCNKPIEGRRHKVLCSNACTIRRHRLRALAKARFTDVLYSLKNKENIAQLIKELEKLIEEINNDLLEREFAGVNALGGGGEK